MNEPVKVDKITYAKTGKTTYDFRVGCIDIGHVWAPTKDRDYFQVRLLFNQERGKVDYDKDMKFQTFRECELYIHTEFKKIIKCLHRYYVINKLGLSTIK